jgi:hypothetical protein
MRDDLASAGDGPAPSQTLENDAIPAVARLRAALGTCDSLLGDCARVAGDKEETSAAQMLAAATAAKLAAASALAASAIARLADAETHQRLATAKIELSLLPSTRRPATRPTPRAERAYDPPDDWSAYSDDDDSESENSTNNRWEDE